MGVFDKCMEWLCVDGWHVYRCSSHRTDDFTRVLPAHEGRSNALLVHEQALNPLWLVHLLIFARATPSESIVYLPKERHQP